MTSTNPTEDTAKDKPAKPSITVTYNGVDQDIEFNPKSTINALLVHAVKLFGIVDNAHTMALWTASGVELPNEGSVEDAGVKPGDLLVLRPSAVRGGSAC